MNFRPSWLIRPGRAEVTTPKLLDVRLVETPLNCVWLNALNDSSRNCSRVPFPSSKFLNSARSRLLTSGPAQGVASRRAEAPGGRLRERRRVEPLRRWSGCRRRDRRRDRRGSVPNVSLSPPRSAACDGDREAALPGVDAVHLPAADHRVLHARSRRPRAARRCRTAGCRRSCRRAGDRRRSPTGRGRAPDRGCSRKPCQPLKLARADAGRRRLGVGALRPRVGERQQRAAAAMLELGVERVVVRPAAPVAVDVDDEVGKRLALGHRRVGRRRTEAPARCCAASAGWCPCVPM